VSKATKRHCRGHCTVTMGKGRKC